MTVLETLFGQQRLRLGWRTVRKSCRAVGTILHFLRVKLEEKQLQLLLKILVWVHCRDSLELRDHLCAVHRSD